MSLLNIDLRKRGHEKGLVITFKHVEGEPCIITQYPACTDKNIRFCQYVLGTLEVANRCIIYISPSDIDPFI